jgi:hypothetical protein
MQKKNVKSELGQYRFSLHRFIINFKLGGPGVRRNEVVIIKSMTHTMSTTDDGDLKHI